MVRYESVEEKDANSAICTKIRSGGGQDAQNETCARLSKSNSNENLDSFARGRLACNRLACKNQRVRRLACLFGFLMFLGLLLNSQNNLFAATLTLEHWSASGNFPEGYYDTTYGVRYDLDTSAKTAIVAGGQQVPSDIANKEGEFWNVVIPDKVSYTEGTLTTEYTVKEIAQCAFENGSYNVLSKKLKGVNIQAASLESIGNWAFNGCSSLTSVEIPDSVTSIGAGAFNGCSSLTSVEIPDSVTSIGEEAFDSCSSLTNVVIPNGVMRIENYTFRDCSSLREITIPKSVESIGCEAFCYCSSLTSVTILGSVESIGEMVFCNCNKLQLVVVSGDYNFEGLIFGWHDGRAFYEYPRCVVKYQDGDGTTVMTGLVFQTFTYTYFDYEQDKEVTVKYEKPGTAADPAKYGIIATWYQVINTETGETSENPFTAWDTPISADLTLKCKNSQFCDVTFQDQAGKVMLTEKVESGKSAIDPAKYGLVATWYKVVDAETGETSENPFTAWDTPISADLTLKCKGPIYTVRYKDGNNTLTERYKFQQKSLKISFNGKPDISMPETISAKEAILLFLSNQKDPESNLFGMHFTITRTVEGNTQTGICQPKPWSKEEKDKLAQEKMLAKTNSDNTFNYYIHSVTTDKANNSFTVYFIVDGNQLSFDSGTGALTAKDYQYEIKEDVVPINYHSTMTGSAS